MTPQGQPQSSVVWIGYDDELILITSTLERFKARNMLANPKVTLLVVDPANLNRFVEIRGRVLDCVADDGDEFVDRQTRAYTGGLQQHFYGDVYPETQRAEETRVIFRIAAVKVNTDAAFA